MRVLVTLILCFSAAAFRSSMERPETIEPPQAVTCEDGNTKETGCLSMCRRLALASAESPNGQCDDFVKRLKEKGYKKLFGGSEPSIEPIVKTLRTNCKEEESVFFLEVLLKFIDKVPEEKRDHKYAEEFQDLRSHVVKKLKEQDPNYEVDVFSCQDGDTAVSGCQSICRWLGLTTSSTNGQCDDYVKTLEGYAKNRKWKFWGHTSSMAPILELLTTNCRKEEVGYYLAGIIQLMERMSEEKKQKYKEPLDKLETLVSDRFVAEVVKAEGQEYEDDDEPLPTCDSKTTIEAGDVVTWELYGPNFEDASKMIGEYKEEKLEYKLHFSYGSHMNYSKKPFNTSTETPWDNRTLGSKAKRLLLVSAKHCGNAFFKVGQAFADAGINLFKGIADLTLFIGTVLGRGTFWTGEKMTSIYANQKQTTDHTDKKTRFTHTEMGIGKNMLSTAGQFGVESFNLCYGERVYREGYLIISRFVGDGTVDAEKYKALAGQRAKMWEPYLNHYSDTVGQWYRTVVGKCYNILGTPGSEDYFQAVSDEAVKEMWDYTPLPEDTEQGFMDGLKESWFTHVKKDGKFRRTKPKAMFCSKFVSAVWSSVIGNPTNQRNATPRSRDLKIMLPLNPGACSPWSVVNWLVSKSGRKSWKSCVAEMGQDKFNPCTKK